MAHLSVEQSVDQTVAKSVTTGAHGANLGILLSVPLQTTLVPLRALGDKTATFTRADPAFTTDFNGVLHLVKVAEARFKGARRVENLLTASEDMTNGVYVALNSAVVDNATEVTFPAAAGQIRNETITVPAEDVGNKVVFSVKISLKSGSISADSDVKIQVHGAAVTNNQADIGNQVTAIPKRFTFANTVTGAGALVPNIQGNTGITLVITEWQLEETTGNTDTTLPGNYVSAGVLSFPFHGTGVDSTQAFKTLNGNTVTSSVVTEATGALIGASDQFADANGPFGYMSEAAATNVALHNRDQTNVVWVKTTMTAAKDEVGKTGAFNSASSLLATAANATSLQTFTIASAAQVTSFYLKRLIGTGTVEITIDNGVTFVPVTLTSVYQRFQTTQTLANPVIGIRIVTSGDKIAVDFSQLETGTFATSEIETTTTSAPRAADVLTYDDVGNIQDAAGTATASVSTDWTFSINRPIAIGRDGINQILFRASGEDPTIIESNDTTNSVASPIGTSMFNAPQKVAASWGDNLTVFAPGTLEAATVAYDGTFGTGPIAIGSMANGFSQWSGTIRNVKISAKETLTPDAIIEFILTMVDDLNNPTVLTVLDDGSVEQLSDIYQRNSPLHVWTNEGFLKELPPHILAPTGARIWENLLRFSEDLSNSVWGKSAGGLGTIPTQLSYHPMRRRPSEEH